VDSVDSTLSNITAENIFLRDRLGQQIHKSSFNNFEALLGEQQVKVDRLETFNKELRNKVDYFIGVIQQQLYSPASQPQFEKQRLSSSSGVLMID
jgi:hypothetical protein